MQYRMIFYLCVYSSFLSAYILTVSLVWILFQIKIRRVVAKQTNPCFENQSKELLLIIIGSLIIFSLLRFFQCWRTYDWALTFKMLLGLMPYSSPRIIYWVLSLPHFVILITLNMWFIKSLQRNHSSSILMLIMFELAAVIIAISIRLTEYVFRSTPVIIPQILYAAMIILCFLAWSRNLRNSQNTP